MACTFTQTHLPNLCTSLPHTQVASTAWRLKTALGWTMAGSSDLAELAGDLFDHSMVERMLAGVVQVDYASVHKVWKPSAIAKGAAWQLEC